MFFLAVAQVPQRSGMLKDLSKFDAEFFKISGKQAKVMDPQLRILQEVVFEALIDAGYNPNQLRGSRTGVYISNNANDALTYFERDLENLPPYYFYGTTRSMLGNRVSYSFDFKGNFVILAQKPPSHSLNFNFIFTRSCNFIHLSKLISSS